MFDLVTAFLHDFTVHDKSCGNLSVCKYSSFRKRPKFVSCSPHQETKAVHDGMLQRYELFRGDASTSYHHM